MQITSLSPTAMYKFYNIHYITHIGHCMMYTLHYIMNYIHCITYTVDSMAYTVYRIQFVAHRYVILYVDCDRCINTTTYLCCDHVLEPTQAYTTLYVVHTQPTFNNHKVLYYNPCREKSSHLYYVCNILIFTNLTRHKNNHALDETARRPG